MDPFHLSFPNERTFDLRTLSRGVQALLGAFGIGASDGLVVRPKRGAPSPIAHRRSLGQSAGLGARDPGAGRPFLEVRPIDQPLGLAPGR